MLARGNIQKCSAHNVYLVGQSQIYPCTHDLHTQQHYTCTVQHSDLEFKEAFQAFTL